MSDGKGIAPAVAVELVKELLAGKRKYIKPKILSDMVFERGAGCGKASPAQVSCTALPRSS